MSAVQAVYRDRYTCDAFNPEARIYCDEPATLLLEDPMGTLVIALCDTHRRGDAVIL